ncbi:unnamed protein product [Protopolystoma xenopodis]|uniref:Uncharacterized protein n=1 Tax=Protopolystoma xenopodis TaxID=117903 RepID=A0A448XED6_9PLAT|nr:unnamed protein product [Protopolystoma xenopodis]
MPSEPTERQRPFVFSASGLPFSVSASASPSYPLLIADMFAIHLELYLGYVPMQTRFRTDFAHQLPSTTSTPQAIPTLASSGHFPIEETLQEALTRVSAEAMPSILLDLVVILPCMLLSRIGARSWCQYVNVCWAYAASLDDE